MRYVRAYLAFSARVTDAVARALRLDRIDRAIDRRQAARILDTADYLAAAGLHVQAERLRAAARIPPP